MKKISILFFAVISAVVFLAGCSGRKPFVEPDPEVVSGHTGGVISKTSTIKVLFNKPFGDNKNTKPEKSFLKFTPEISGESQWVDEYSLEFKPKSILSPGTLYFATIDFTRLPKYASQVNYCNFAFAVKRPFYNISFDSLKTGNINSGDTMELEGRIVTEDKEGPGKVEKILKIHPMTKGLSVTWDHSGDQVRHTFVIRGIRKQKKNYPLKISWNGSPINSSVNGSKEIPIPGSDKFEVIEIRPFTGDEEYIGISFSEALAEKQDLRGLVQISGIEDLKFAVSGNRLKVYSPSRRLSEKADVIVEKGIRSVSGSELALAIQASINVEYQKPQIRFSQTGVILPTTQGLTVPVETLNLNSIMVEAIKVHGSNMTQFLQVNSFDTDNELFRVGKVVWKKVIPIGWSENQANTWVRSGLDLTQLIKDNPDGMFQLQITFRKPHIEYPCAAQFSEDEEASANNIDFPQLPGVPGKLSNESSYWNYYESENQKYWNWYDRRFDPCHPAFYRSYEDHNIIVKKNVLVSNIGLTAKLDMSNALHVFCTDLRNTVPLNGVRLKALDFTQQVIGTGTSDKQGFASITCSEAPFFLVAENAGQSGYLRLDEGSVLATSQFDVGGEIAKEGIKGLIYAERGVWRPGDAIYLTFALFDPNKVIPPKHPITLEMIDPRGQVSVKTTKTESLNGFYPIGLSTPPDAPTGDWVVRVKLGGSTFTKNLKIENVMPNRLKIDLKFSGKPYIAGNQVNGTLSAEWLHGAKAPNLKADISSTFSPAITTFSKYPDYTFDDPTRESIPGRQEIFSGNLDSNGTCSFNQSIYLSENVSGKLKANFLARVYESSGAFSSDQFTMDFFPYNQFVGIKTEKGDEARGMLLTDIDHKVDIVLLTPEGLPVSSGKVTAEIFKIKWRWWWEKQPESLADYAESRSVTKVQTDTVNISNGKGEWNFKVRYPEWGRFYIRITDMAGRHSAGKIAYIDWPGWAGRGQKESPGGANVLTLTSDKQTYSVGDVVRVTFPSNKDGAALVCIEAGGKIIKKEWVVPKPDTTGYQFNATAEMAPNIYVHVTFLQPHLQTANDLPIRVYGVIPVSVENPVTHLSPKISVAETFEPGSDFTVTVSELSGKPMTYTLAVVDEGLLGLTRFKVSNPWDSFYAKEASLLKSWDLFSWVAGAYSGKLSTLLAIGGGDEAGPKGGRKANRFPPIVKFFGPIAIGKNDKKTHTFTLPNYVGALRCMVVAGSGNAYGTAEKTVTIKSDVMVLGTLPRVLSPNEKSEFPVSVFANDPNIKVVTVYVKAEGPVAIDGNSEQTVSFQSPGDKLIKFKIKVGKSTGKAVFTVRAMSDSKKTAEHRIELDIRSLGTPVAKVMSKLIDKGDTWTETITLPGAAGTNFIGLEVSPLPPIDLEKRLRFLIMYPHGCIEQTTSSVFPQVSLDDLVELSAERKKEIQNNIKAGIERLKLFQTGSGGFGYWPGDAQPSDWGSTYAGHFLIEAQKRGYALPPVMLDNLMAYQKKRANEWDSNSDDAKLEQAYRLYMLALSGNPEIGAMNRLREKGSNPVAVIWRLAASYVLAGQAESAKNMVSGKSVNVKPYKELDAPFGSDLRDEAMILEALVLLDMVGQADPIVKEISQRLSGDEWISTQSTAYALIAMVPYATKINRDNPLSVTYSWLGGKDKTVSAAGKMIVETIAAGDATTGTVKIRNEGNAKIYPRLILRGTPLLDNETYSSNGITMSVGYKDENGTPVEPGNVGQGEDILVDVTTTNLLPYDLPNLALTLKLPSGWEIINQRLAQDENDPGESGRIRPYDYMDIRDDRVYLYFGLTSAQRNSGNSTKTFTVRVNNSYKGEFYLPACSVEAMYDATVQAIVPGRWLK